MLPLVLAAGGAADGQSVAAPEGGVRPLMVKLADVDPTDGRDAGKARACKPRKARKL